MDTLENPCELYYHTGLNLEREFTAHQYYEILFVRNGTLDINTMDGVYHAKGNALILIPPGVYHCNRLTGNSAAYIRYILMFTEEFMEDIADRESLLRPFADGIAIHEPDPRQQKMLTDTLEKLYHDNTPLHARILLQVLLYDICQFGAAIKPSGSANRNYILNVMEYISEHYCEKLLVEDIAKRFGVSRTKLLTDFRQHMTFPLGNYIMRERVMRARRLLKDGMTVSETAERCGFSSDTHLRYCFHVIMGMSPSEYRKHGERVRN